MPRATQSNPMKRAVSYGPDPLLVGFWALIVSPPAWVGVYFLLKSPSYHGFVGLLWAVALPLLPVVFASGFRVTFAPSEFVYRRWVQLSEYLTQRLIRSKWPILPHCPEKQLAPSS
jgi:hypothetical protein